MKLVSKLKKFCKTCKTHVLHKIIKIKKGKTHTLSWIARQKQRYGESGNKGKYSKKPTKRYKTAKKPHILLTCSTCETHKNMHLKKSIKFELV